MEMLVGIIQAVDLSTTCIRVLAMMAAIWSELGQLQHQGVLGHGEMGVHVMGTGSQ